MSGPATLERSQLTDSATRHPERLAVRIRDLRKDYELGDEIVRALHGINLDVPEGDYVAIMGPSGSGKSTLLNLLGCLDKPTSGEYFLGDENVAALDDLQLSAIRASRIGFVFQSYNLIPQLTVLENIELPLTYRGGVTSAELHCVRELADLVGLGHRLGHRATQLSGGQQQRVGIARSLVNDPKFILADEPTGNLDSGTTAEILDLLDTLNAEGKTIILVTHEEDVARRARRIIRLRDGEIVADERTGRELLFPLPSGGEGRGEGATRSMAFDAEELQETPGPLTPNPSPPKGRGETNTVGIRLPFRSLRTGFKSLKLHPLRALLTVLGIFIGVASVVWLLAIGEGISAKAQEQIAGMGTSNILVRSMQPSRDKYPNYRGNGPYGITRDDCELLRQTIPSVRRIAPTRESRERSARHRDHVVTAEILGCTLDFMDLYQLQLAAGRFLTELDGETEQTVCVLSQEIVDKLFPAEDPLGKSVRVGEEYLRVVGVVKPRERFEGIRNAVRSQDFGDNLYIPITTYWRRFGDSYGTTRPGSMTVSGVTLMVHDQTQVLQTSELIKQTLAERHPFEDHVVTVPLELLEQARTTRLMFIALMGLIAAISLVVGGIGIMNIMLATVTERTREIGIRRALGANRGDIIRQFLTETVVLSVTGGITGILGGLTCGPLLAGTRWLLQSGFPNAVAAMPEVMRTVTPIIVPWSIPLAFGISVAVGVIFGLYPARRAAAMDPIEALRYVA